MVNKNGDRKSPNPGVVLGPSTWPFLWLTYKWGLLNHLLTGIILKVSDQEGSNAQKIRAVFLPYKLTARRVSCFSPAVFFLEDNIKVSSDFFQPPT